jgi:GNAT superfamily N-acetyltransferase
MEQGAGTDPSGSPLLPAPSYRIPMRRVLALQVMIRPAVRSDRSAVLALVPRLRAFGPSELRPTDAMDAAERRALEEAFDAPPEGSLLLVAGDAGGPVLGAAYAFPSTDYFTGETHGHLSILAVAAEAEGRGVGRALLGAVERWASDQGYRFVTLNVFVANGRARAVYERAGWTPDTMRYVKEIGAPRGG